MTTTLAGAAPPGWYPDPTGERQWRVWTGEQWSALTRPFGSSATAVHGHERIELVRDLHRLSRYGIVAVLAGLGMVVSVLAHWPGTAQPASATFAALGVDTGLSLLALGTVSFALAARSLAGRWTLPAVLPGINVLFVTGLMTERLDGRRAQRVAAEAVLLALFVTQFHVQPWLGLALVMVATGQFARTSSLIDELSSSLSSSSPEAPPYVK